MKGILIALLTMAIFVVGGALYIIAYPYYTYNKIVNSNYKMSWFYLNKYSSDYISPSRPQDINYQKIKNPETWQKFHFGSGRIMLRWEILKIEKCNRYSVKNSSGLTPYGVTD